MRKVILGERLGFMVLAAFCEFHGAAVRSATTVSVDQEIGSLTFNNPTDVWSDDFPGGGIIVPRNRGLDLPARRLSPTQLFHQPAAG